MYMKSRIYKSAVCLLILSCLLAAPSSVYSQENGSNLEDLFEILEELNRDQQLSVLDYAQDHETQVKEAMTAAWANLSDDEKFKVVNLARKKAGRTMLLPKAKGPVAKIMWMEFEYDFNYAKEGDIVEHVFEFKNIGDSVPLTITDVSTSCGCTVPEWTDKPVLPGETGKIVVRFNSKGKDGENTELITIKGNTHPAKTVLILKGKVYKRY